MPKTTDSRCKNIHVKLRSLAAEPPVSEAGVAIMRRSSRELCARHGINEEHYVRDMAKVMIDQIDEGLQLLAQADGGTSADKDRAALAIRFTATRERLLKDVDHIFHHRQASLELQYRGYLAAFRRYLGESTKALSMIDITHIETIECEMLLSSNGSLADRIARIAENVDIFSPLLDTSRVGGFAAEASRLVRAIKLYYGIPDCMHYSSRLVCSRAIHDDGMGKLLIRDMRQYPMECENAVAVMRQLIELAVGKRVSVRIAEQQMTARQIGVAQKLEQGALMFVIFHELAHILLPQQADPHDEEYACDAFAASAVVASCDPNIVCGLYMGLFLTSAILHEV